MAHKYMAEVVPVPSLTKVEDSKASLVMFAVGEGGTVVLASDGPDVTWWSENMEWDVPGDMDAYRLCEQLPETDPGIWVVEVSLGHHPGIWGVSESETWLEFSGVRNATEGEINLYNRGENVWPYQWWWVDDEVAREIYGDDENYR